MTTCSWVEPSTLRIHIADKHVDIAIQQVELRSPNHILVVNPASVIQAEILVGLNEIMVQYNHIGYQCAMNEQVRSGLELFVN